MNAIDLLFVLLVLGGLAVGFFQGTVRLIISILAFYVGIILASLYFQFVGNFFRQRFNTSQDVGSVMAFGIVLLLSFFVLSTAGMYTFRYVQFPTGLDFLDRIVGTVFGLVLGCLALGILALLLRDIFVLRDMASAVSFPITRAIQSNVRSSLLVEFFSTNILPLIYTIVRPALPNQSDLIFKL